MRTSWRQAAQRVFGLLIKYVPVVWPRKEYTENSQTVNNACASVALLNIVNNIPDIDLGDHLQQFKLFTADFTPALRGDAIGNFEFVKSVHNSFAR